MPSLTCVRENLDLFLEGKIPAGKEASWHDHLEGCPQCQARLEEMAGGNRWWKEAKAFLATSTENSCADATPSGPSRLQSSARNPDPHRAELEPAEPAQDAISLDFLTPTDDPESLGRLGSYEVTGIVGQGGSGIVLKAFDRSLNRNVAIKVLAPHLAASGAARKRFAREAQAAAAVVHEHVVPIFAVTLQQNLPYIVMQYFPGQSLQHRLDRDGPLELREILRIGLQTARGLAAAHAQGLIHRDVKPANILLADGIERISLSDFGLARALDDARLTRTGWLAGTPEYMSPEQSRGKAMDARSDLFSLGSVLYTACTGRVPFHAETSYGTLRLVSDEEPAPVRQLNADIPEWLCVLIGKLMAKQPEDRFGSAAEVADLLEACLAHVQQPDTTRLPELLLKNKRRPLFQGTHRRRILAGILLGLGGFFLGWFGFWQGAGPPDIAGPWTGESWGAIQLKHLGSGSYEGTYSAASGKRPGQLQLKWSQAEQRFGGTWREGEDRFGELSLSLKKEEIRGALITAHQAKTDPSTPRLTDFLWVKGESPGSAPLHHDQSEKLSPHHPQSAEGIKSTAEALGSQKTIADSLSGTWIPTVYAEGLFHVRQYQPDFPPPAWDFGDGPRCGIIFFLSNPFRVTYKVLESKNPILIQLDYPNGSGQYFRINIQREKLAICAHKTKPPKIAAPTEECEYWELRPFQGDVYKTGGSIQYAYRLDQPPSSEVWPLLKDHHFPLPPSQKIPSPKLVCTFRGGETVAKESKPLLLSSEKQSWKILKHGTRSQISWVHKRRTIFKDRPDEETYEFTGMDFPKGGNLQNWSKSVDFNGKSVIVMESPTYSIAIEPSDLPPYPSTSVKDFPAVQAMLSKLASLPSGMWHTKNSTSGRNTETVVKGQKALVIQSIARKERVSSAKYDFESAKNLDILWGSKKATFNKTNICEKPGVDLRCGFFDIDSSPIKFEKTGKVNDSVCNVYRFYNTGNQNYDFTSGLVWIDQGKSLPVHAEWTLQDGTTANTTFEWDKPINDRWFSMKAPEGFSVKNAGLLPEANDED